MKFLISIILILLISNSYGETRSIIVDKRVKVDTTTSAEVIYNKYFKERFCLNDFLNVNKLESPESTLNGESYIFIPDKFSCKIPPEISIDKWSVKPIEVKKAIEVPKKTIQKISDTVIKNRIFSGFNFIKIESTDKSNGEKGQLVSETGFNIQFQSEKKIREHRYIFGTSFSRYNFAKEKVGTKSLTKFSYNLLGFSYTYKKNIYPWLNIGTMATYKQGFFLRAVNSTTIKLEKYYVPSVYLISDFILNRSKKSDISFSFAIGYLSDVQNSVLNVSEGYSAKGKFTYSRVYNEINAFGISVGSNYVNQNTEYTKQNKIDLFLMGYMTF